MKKICEYCGKEFNADKKSRKYCSNECKVKARTKRVKTTCDYCGKDIEVKRCELKRSKHHYCSKECMGKHKSIIQIGENNPCYRNAIKTYTCDYCGKEFERTQSQVNGKHHIFCSYECKDKANSIYYSKENHPRWNPDLTEEDRIRGRMLSEDKQWRKQVFERDNYTCQCCGDNKGGNLNAHHKDGYNWCEERRYDVTNGVTLCEDCHKEFHDIYGYGNNTEEQYNEWINNKDKDNEEVS